MRYISVECKYFSAKFVPNPALLSEMFLSKAMSIHRGGVDEQGKGQAHATVTTRSVASPAGIQPAAPT
jgi:hypothetical protein